MKPATEPRSPAALRVLVVDGASGATSVVPGSDLATLFRPGDVVVVNDAATLPASLHGRTESGEPVELRLAGHLEGNRWIATLFGAGDWHTPTEARAKPFVTAGERLRFDADLAAVVRAARPERSLVEVELGLASHGEATPAEIWSALYRVGRPVQYAHVPAAFALWDVQNVYAGRPWAVEMPSAGRALRIETLLELRRRGVEIAWVTHAAGLSSIGDEASDVVLPLPERYEIGEPTWEAIARARACGGRVIAIGTSTARALEGAARDARRTGITAHRLGPGVRRAIVDAVMTGGHDVGTSHHELLGAFVDGAVLERALAVAEEAGLLGHEMGDAWLVWGSPRRAQRCSTAAAAPTVSCWSVTLS